MACVGRQSLSQSVNNIHGVFPGLRAGSSELWNWKQKDMVQSCACGVEELREQTRQTDLPKKDSEAH
jgi:hypothetical protein